YPFKVRSPEGRESVRVQGPLLHRWWCSDSRGEGGDRSPRTREGHEAQSPVNLRSMTLPKTFYDLKRSSWAEAPLLGRSVRDEIRANLLAALASGLDLFPGIVGYDDTILPQLTNALLARHHFILLGLRGQAKSRILRQLVGFLDEVVPVVAGSEVN